MSHVYISCHISEYEFAFNIIESRIGDTGHRRLCFRRVSGLGSWVMVRFLTRKLDGLYAFGVIELG